MSWHTTAIMHLAVVHRQPCTSRINFIEKLMGRADRLFSGFFLWEVPWILSLPLARQHKNWPFIYMLRFFSKEKEKLCFYWVIACLKYPKNCLLVPIRMIGIFSGLATMSNNMIFIILNLLENFLQKETKTKSGMIQVEDEDGTVPEWQVPEATAVPYTVYDLSHPISHLDEYLHIILSCMTAQLYPQVTARCVAYTMSLWHWTHPPFSTLCSV